MNVRQAEATESYDEWYTFTGSHMTEHTQLHGWTISAFDISHDGNPSCDSEEAALVHSPVAYTFTGTRITEHTQLHGWAGGGLRGIALWVH